MQLPRFHILIFLCIYLFLYCYANISSDKDYDDFIESGYGYVVKFTIASSQHRRLGRDLKVLFVFLFGNNNVIEKTKVYRRSHQN